MMGRFCLVLWLTAGTFACGPIYYAPNALNAPMIAGKGDATVGAQFGDRDSIDVQGSYSPVERVAFLFDAYRAEVGNTGNVGYGGGHLVEVGAGYYRPLTPHTLWDVYGLVGFGSVDNHFSSRDISASLVRFGAQSSAGFRSRFFDAFGSARVVGLRYYDVQGNDTVESIYLKNTGAQFLFEPAVTVRAGYHLKFQFQVGHSFNLTDASFKQEDGMLSIGLVYVVK